MIQLKDWDTDNILVSTKIYSGENNNRTLLLMWVIVIELNSEIICNKKFLKTKTKSYGDEGLQIYIIKRCQK